MTAVQRTLLRAVLLRLWLLTGVVLGSSCASLERTPAPPSPAPASATASTTPPAPAVEVKGKAATPAPRTVAPKTAAAAPESKAVAPKTVAAAPTPKAVKPETSAAPPKPSIEPLNTQAPAPRAKKEAAAPPTAAAALDLKGLETRLRETKAVGLMTKLALKNQVDDLLDEFRAFYQGKKKTTLRELRHSYDLLMLKVLALLQDADPSLAKAITNSREAIWGILADPTKFASV